MIDEAAGDKDARLRLEMRDEIRRIDAGGSTALLFAAQNGDVESAAALLGVLRQRDTRLARRADGAVVNVGQVHHLGDGVARVLQVAAQHVGYCRAVEQGLGRGGAR